MKTTVRTTTGSTYVLDKNDLTWTRLFKSPASGQMRTETGKLDHWPNVKVGESLVMIGPALNPHSGGRMIITSKVIGIEHEETTETPHQVLHADQDTPPVCDQGELVGLD